MAMAAAVLAAPAADVPAGSGEPDPVIIVAGSYADHPVADVFYAPLQARLRADGYTAHVFGLPGGGLGDIRDTAQHLAEFVGDVRDETGADRVNLIGHSQGGIVSRYYIQGLGGANEVGGLISLAVPHRGTAITNLAIVVPGGCIGSVACEQLAIGSEFLAELNEGDDSPGDVRYTNIVTVYDTLVVPYTSGLLTPDDNNTNVLVQGQCPLRVVGHSGLALDGAVYTGITAALENQAITLNCTAL